MMSRQINNAVKREFEEINDPKSLQIRSKRAERRFNPLKDRKREYSQTAYPSVWTENITRKPNKITSTKPDLDLLFSLFSVVEENCNESESEYEGSLSPETSPFTHSRQAALFPIIPSQTWMPTSFYQNCNNNNNQQTQTITPCIPANYISIEQLTMQNSQFEQYEQCSTDNSYSPYSCEPSSNEDDYSASFEQETVNSYDIMTFLPPIFDGKLTERVLPFSELVDVFNM